MECMKSELDTPLKYLSQNLDSPKSTASTENVDQFAFNCTGQSNLFTDWRRLKLRVKLSKIVGRESVVGVVSGYGLDGPGIKSRWGEIFRNRPDRVWGPPNLLYNTYRVIPEGKTAEVWR